MLASVESEMVDPDVDGMMVVVALSGIFDGEVDMSGVENCWKGDIVLDTERFVGD